MGEKSWGAQCKFKKKPLFNGVMCSPWMSWPLALAPAQERGNRIFLSFPDFFGVFCPVTDETSILRKRKKKKKYNTIKTIQFREERTRKKKGKNFFFSLSIYIHLSLSSTYLI